MERSIQKHGLINLLALLGVGAAALAVARYSNTQSGLVGVLFIGLGLLVAAVSWFQMRLEDQERLEKLEFDELAKSKGGSALFEAKDSEVFPVQRSREQFERFFVPIFTIIVCAAQLGGAYMFWRWLAKSPVGTTKLVLASPLKEPMSALALFGLLALILFLLGKFSTTITRIENHRLLRPGASYLLLAAYLCAVVAAGVGGVMVEYFKADYYVALSLCVILGLVGLETLINLVLEVYRPRVKGKVQRPLYESRLVGLLGQPEGLITTAAQALDYQFGFSVSETWFYRLFFEKWLKWLILAQVLVLVFSTCFVVVNSGEQGLLEHFGRPSERNPLRPGLHLKLPWPMDMVYLFQTEQIQSFELGVIPKAGSESREERETIVLWTVAHSENQEENLLVANRVPVAEAAEADSSKRIPPVSLLTGSIPVQFQITNLPAWAYTNEDSPSLLQDLAKREIVRYFVNADMAEVLSYGRHAASQELTRRVQAAADQHHMGANIITVSLQDLHPPVKVAADYEKVVAALHTKQATILAARADEIRTNSLSAAQAATIVNRAEAERRTREVHALAEAALFTNQIPAFMAAPSVYVQRSYLQTFARATASSRKYLLLTTNTSDVIVFDLQDSVAQDLLNVQVPQAKK
jgi:regulator of protease activity HflC (stomatin/prohibitin superfamily)